MINTILIIPHGTSSGSGENLSKTDLMHAGFEKMKTMRILNFFFYIPAIPPFFVLVNGWDFVIKRSFYSSTS